MKLHQIELMGREFRIRSDDPEGHVEAVADYVNDQIASVAGGQKHVAMPNVLLLASLNMADELFKLRAEHEALVGRLRAQSRALIERLDRPQPAAH